MAPEIADGIITPAVDWYGIGATFLSFRQNIDRHPESTEHFPLDICSDDLEQRNRCHITTQIAWEGFSYCLNRLWTKIYISQGRNFPRHILVNEPNLELRDLFDIGSTKYPDDRTNFIISMILYYNRRNGVFIDDNRELEWNLLGSYQDHYEWWWSMCQCFCHESIRNSLSGVLLYEPTIAIDLATLFRMFLSKQKSTNEAEMPFWHCLLHAGILACESAPKLYSIFFQNDFFLWHNERNSYRDTYCIRLNQTLYKIDLANTITRIMESSTE